MPKINKIRLGKFSNGMSRRKGFLLLEVMISIVVITGGLLFVMRVYSTAKEALDRSRTLFTRSLLLEEKMFDFEEKGIIEEDTDHGRFTDKKDYSWEIDAVSLAPQGQPFSDLCAVKLCVFHDKSSSQAGPPDKYYLFTYLNKKI